MFLDLFVHFVDVIIKTTVWTFLVFLVYLRPEAIMAYLIFAIAWIKVIFYFLQVFFA